MAEVVMKLHEYSAEYEDLQESCFEALYSSSESTCRRVLHYLNQVVHQLPVKYALALADEDDPVMDEVTLSAEIHPQFKAWPHPNEETRPELAFPIRHHTGTSYFHKPQLSRPMSKSHTTPSSLPFIGYTFKRFDDSEGNQRLNNEVPQQISPPTNSNITRSNHATLPLSTSLEAVQAPLSPTDSRDSASGKLPESAILSLSALKDKKLKEDGTDKPPTPGSKAQGRKRTKTGCLSEFINPS
jgi:hypothetical protein